MKNIQLFQDKMFRLGIKLELYPISRHESDHSSSSNLGSERFTTLNCKVLFDYGRYIYVLTLL